jgi:superfamily I DNA/RNA helicase
MFQLRPAQEKILQYENGRLAISAVPGSGKTFTLSLLAAQLIENGRIDPQSDQQILIVTYLNASVDTFKARIRQRLMERELPTVGFDVRTLHSLALEILRTAHGNGRRGGFCGARRRPEQSLSGPGRRWLDREPSRPVARLSTRQQPTYESPLARHHRTHRPCLYSCG